MKKAFVFCAMLLVVFGLTGCARMDIKSNSFTLELGDNPNQYKTEYVKLKGFKELPYLQSIKKPDSVKIKRASDGTQKAIDNIVCCLFDKESLGIYKKDLWTSTTPFNSAGGYANTYWHLKNMYFNDLSENFVLFYLA